MKNRLQKAMTTKEKVLNFLQNNSNQNQLSGEFLAEKCNVSRAAIWKAVNALRSEGCHIEGTPNGGYILCGDADIFSLELFNEEVKIRFPDYAKNHVEYFKEIDSTNTHAKRLLTGCGNLRDAGGQLTVAGKKYHNAVIVAESQTAGRGRLGRTFYSPYKTGIYLTVIYAPKGGITNPAKTTAFTAVAVNRAIKKLYGIETSIKWINDIFYNRKKIAGILTEGFTNFETGTIESAIIGIGVNIQPNEILPDEVKKIAGALEENPTKENHHVSRVQLAAEIAGQTISVLQENPAKIMEEYKAASFLIGRKIKVHPIIGDEKSVYSATVIDISDEAGLIVENEDGVQKTLSSGEVSIGSENI